ncbi:MAG: glycosyltransferase family 2 protein [Candidatus Chisholmbacteria bacterium]|nr:glycosyltransferase family 2 protein [Candidatus Chisholmbacteria bacterium]
MDQPLLSVVISTHNSETVLGDCLKSVKTLSPEIIIVDNESTDDTGKIAQKFTPKILSHHNNPLALNQAKNYGFDHASGVWILSLDPDERLSKKLAQEIKSVLASYLPRRQAGKLKVYPVAKLYGAKSSPAAYQMPRQNIIFGKWIKHGLWYPDEQIRLFQKGQARFPAQHNHEKLEVAGAIGSLTHHLIHYNYTSVTQYLDKINHMYSDNEAQNLVAQGKKVAWYDAIRLPLTDFLNNFFAREGYKDGLHGLVLSLMQAFYTFVVFAKVWEKQQFAPYNHPRFLEQVSIEFKTKLKEYTYWYHQKIGIAPKVTSIKSTLKKLLSRF